MDSYMQFISLLRLLKVNWNKKGLSLKVSLITLLLFLSTCTNPNKSIQSITIDGLIKSGPLIPYRKGINWGFSDTAGNIIVMPKYDEIEFTDHGFKVMDRRLWGLANKYGNIILPCQFHQIEIFSSTGLYKIFLNEKEGIVDSSGQILVPPKYDIVRLLKDDLYSASVFSEKQINGRYQQQIGIYRKGRHIVQNKYSKIEVSSTGQVILETEYGSKLMLVIKPETVTIEKFKFKSRYHHGIAVIDFNGKGDFRFINQQGKIAFNGSFKQVRINDNGEIFSNGLAAVSIDGIAFGFVDTTGKTIIPFNYSDVTAFSNKVAIVKKAGKYGIIDTLGKEIEPFNFNSLKWTGFLGRIEGKKEEYFRLQGYFNPNGSRTEVKYHLIHEFNEGLAKVIDLQRKVGYINRKGQEVIPTIYNEGKSFSEGLVAVKLDNKWGFIDSTGKLKIPFNYFDSDGKGYYFFQEGIASVMTNYNTWIYIDRNNKSITKAINYEHYKPAPFFKGFAPVISDWKDKTDAAHKKYKAPIYTIINKKGKPISNMNFSMASNKTLTFNLLSVSQDSGWGFIDTTGKIIIPLEYQFEPKPTNNQKYTVLHNDFLKVLSSNRKKNLGYMSLTGKKYWED